ncbi:MAG TPA: hypothetical protein VGF79_05890 [Bacteroidia bacterium]
MNWKEVKTEEDWHEMRTICSSFQFAMHEFSDYEDWLFSRAFAVVYEDNSAFSVLFHGQNSKVYFGCLGLLDSSDAKRFIQKLCVMVREKCGPVELHGPINGNSWYSYRLPIDHSESLFVGDPTCKGFSHHDFIDNGFEVAQSYETYLQKDLSGVEPIESSRLMIKYHSLEELQSMLPVLYDVSIEAFKHAAYFTDMPKDLYIDRYASLLPFGKLDLMPYVWHENGQLMAYSFCYNGFEKGDLVLKTLASRNNRLSAGAGRLMASEIISKARSMGYSRIWHALMHSNNVSKIMSGKFKGEPYKKYAVYRKKLY